MLVHSIVTVLLQISLCQYVAGAPSDVSNITATSNDSSLSITPWPNLPFDSPLSSTSPQNGFVRFTKIGAPASQLQTAAWERHIAAILHLPDRPDFSKHVGVFVPEFYGRIHPFFWQANFSRGGLEITSEFVRSYLAAVRDQVQAHGLNEMQNKCEKVPATRGRMRLSLADTSSTPLQTPIFLYVATKDERTVMVEIVSFNTTAHFEAITDVLEGAHGSLRNFAPDRQFQGFVYNRKSWILKLNRDSSLPSTYSDFDYKVATLITTNLGVLEGALKGSIEFRVWIKPGVDTQETGTTLVGTGSLLQAQPNGKLTDLGLFEPRNGTRGDTQPSTEKSEVIFS